MTALYQPKRGDFVWIDLNPQAGTEQAGRRPALVLSDKAFNIATGLMIACPVTSQVKGGSFEVPLPSGMRPTGVVLCDHVKSLDWLTRNAEYIGVSSTQLIDDVTAKIVAIIGL